MTTRRGTAPEPKVPASLDPHWPPTCQHCGWTGEPNTEQTPYAYCGGDPARHQRPPVGARFVRERPAVLPAQPTAPAELAVTLPRPAGGVRRDGGRPSLGRGECSVCGADRALVRGPDGAVVANHGPGNRCPGGEYPPARVWSTRHGQPPQVSDDGLELHPGYISMAVANGLPRDHPSLRSCRLSPWEEPS